MPRAGTVCEQRVMRKSGQVIWIKPYVAGFYAWRYEGRKITREEAEREMARLLAYEQRALMPETQEARL